MSWRHVVLSAALLISALLVACGGDDEDVASTATPIVEAPAAAATPTAAEPSLPAPRPKADSDVAITVVTRGQTYTPTIAEFKALPTSEVDAGGKKKGVSLQVLAAKVGAPETAVATIEGRTPDLTRQTYYRGALKDAGSGVFVLDEFGHLTFYSTVLAKDAWIPAVEAVSLQ